MVTEGIDGSYADAEHPFAAKGSWLHIFLKQAFVTKMLNDIDKADQVSFLVNTKCKRGLTCMMDYVYNCV